jgi:chromosome segregation protein
VRQGIEEIRADQERLIVQIEQAESMDDLQDIKEFARSIQQRLFELKTDIENGKKEEKKIEKIEIATVAKPIVKVDSTVIAEYKEKIITIRTEIQKVQNEIKELEQSIALEHQNDRQKRQKFFEVERNFRAKQEELSKLKDQFNESKIALARVEVHEEDLRASVLKELRLQVEDLKDVVVEQIDRGQLERDIAKLKIQMEQIGGIDPLVVEEYEETNKRFEFLTKESEDLENAIVSLREIIKEMDQKINGEFASTFEEINKEFTKYFRIIFGGGNATLKKVEVRKRSYKAKAESEIGTDEAEDESLENANENREERSEIGIDISASPPGKKISNLSMLSGGERSLTSLALLFAIISHNPPPFAVLDEVEAALDEANSKRFSRIIQELSDSTQFVIITHNRETMRQASMLYGVTMGDDGMSKLLSVRLDQVGQGGKILQ